MLASFFGSGPIIIIICLLLLLPLFNASSKTAALGNSSVRHLDVGSNFSFAAFLEGAPNYTYPDGQSVKNLVGIPGAQMGAARAGDVFLPILSSPGFNTSDPSSSPGFSFGFYLQVLAGGPEFLMYVAVCGGLSGNWSVTDPNFFFSSGGNGVAYPYRIARIRGGFVTPVWVANAHRPLPAETSSLVVVGTEANSSHGTRNLQLQDERGTVVWSVEDVGMMEMQDTGNLVIYNSINKSKVVWQSLSQPRDTLIQRQKLTVGMELVSNDSAYTARMEEGGLVVYLNKPQFIEHPAAYWVIPSFPLTLSPPVTKADLKSQVLESRCARPHEPGYVVLENHLGFFMLDLKAGQCTQLDNVSTSFVLVDRPYPPMFAWCSLKLEIDGRLHVYAVDMTVYPPDLHKIVVGQKFHIAFVDWGDCAAPMACGPLGICTPFARSLCACPHPSPEGTDLFESIDATDFSKGCTLVTPLPHCIHGDEHVHTTDYLQLEETSTTFLFGGWPFAFTTSPRVEECMRLCSANCSCTGFFYQVTKSACFFMTDGIGLLHTINRSNSVISDINSPNGTILASSFVTYLKINSSSQHKSKHVFTIAITTVVACLLMLGLVLYALHARKDKRKTQAWRKAKQEEEEELLKDILPLIPRRFSYDDLQRATKGFSELLGAGGCGSVYAGALPDGHRVAVKMLEASMLNGQQSKQFLAEVATVGRTSHHNIVGLVGFCWEVYHPRMLVYEYMERGSLDQWLFAKVAKSAQPAPQALDWQTRHNVALGIARGLSYLHEDCPQPILHFDIKPQNILLDDAFVAKLADFGMSRRMQRGISEVVTGVRGTPGYIAPEWLAHGSVSKKSDIYSMGMVMLEIVGGRKNIDISLLNSASEEWHFPSWAAKKCEQGLMLELLDKRITHAYDREQACRLIQTAFWCIHENPSQRPSAPTVMQWLEGSGFIKEPPFSTIARFTQSSSEVSSL